MRAGVFTVIALGHASIVFRYNVFHEILLDLLSRIAEELFYSLSIIGSKCFRVSVSSIFLLNSLRTANIPLGGTNLILYKCSQN